MVHRAIEELVQHLLQFHLGEDFHDVVGKRFSF